MVVVTDVDLVVDFLNTVDHDAHTWVRHRVSLNVDAGDEQSARIDETSWGSKRVCRKRGFSPRSLWPRCGLRERKRQAKEMKGVERTGIPTSAPYDE